jgi:hypothetical protein
MKTASSRFRLLFFCVLPLALHPGRSAGAEDSGTLKINTFEYFDRPGLSVLVFHNTYPEGKQGGIEIIQHGDRIAACGDLRLEPTPGQWDPLPKPWPRKVDRGRNEIAVPLTYPAPGIDYSVRVSAQGNAIRIAVDLNHPVPPAWSGKVGFNMELYPAAFFGKTFRFDGAFGLFPRQASGISAVDPEPLGSGGDVWIAAEDPIRRIHLVSNLPVSLYDGRLTDQNGWFVLRTLVPDSALREAVSWTITPNVIPGWVRDPVVGFSQIGYHPNAEKIAVIELDPKSPPLGTACLFRIGPDGQKTKALCAEPRKWGGFLRYDYALFDFTRVVEPGLYRIAYGSSSTPAFPIAKDVFMRDAWQPTLETFLPMQMCHVEVRDAFRTWHGACHLDDALEAPLSHEHFDGYRQSAASGTPFSPGVRIPFLDRGGWHDAGDDDLAANSQSSAVWTLALIREEFPVADIDHTTVRPDRRLVVCHRPDGIPDLAQQIAHGAENLISGYRAAGHSFLGIISNSLLQYTFCGDPSVATDNKLYDASVDSTAVVCGRSARPDDRWAFTDTAPSLELKVGTALAAASRNLRNTHPALADECLSTALTIWRKHRDAPKPDSRVPYTPGNIDAQKLFAAVELYLTTRDTAFRDAVSNLKPAVLARPGEVGWSVTRILADLDPAFQGEFRKALENEHITLGRFLAENPYRVPVNWAVWGIGWRLLDFAMNQYYLAKAFPDLVQNGNLLRALNWVLGCHPGSNTSFVSGVGARSLTVAYGFNRADWSYIPGGPASGVALIRPDFPELKEPFPFLWQQAEYLLAGATSYMFCVLAADRLLNP